jgi:hypothetical protein
MRSRGLLAAFLGGLMLCAGIGTSSAQAETEHVSTGTSPRANPVMPPKGVEFLSSVPQRQQLAEGMPIRVRYLGNAESAADRPEFFLLLALNPASNVYEIRALPLSECGRPTKKFGTRCTFVDLPEFWDGVARDADRLGVKAGNARGFGPMGTIAGTWLADSAIVAECILAAGEDAGREIKLSLAGAIGGAMSGIIPIPGLDYLTGPVVEAGVSATVDFAITQDVKKSATSFLKELGLNAGEAAADAVLKSEKKFVKSINDSMKKNKLFPKSAKGLAAVAGGILVIKDYKDTYENYFVDEQACIG